MGDVQWEVSQFALNTSLGTQDIRIPAMTQTPNLAIFIISKAISNGSGGVIDDARIGFGVTDGSSNFAIIANSPSATDPTNDKRKAITDGCFLMTNSSGTVLGQASFDSWLEDEGSGAGIRISIDDLPDNNYLVQVWLAKVDSVDIGTFHAASVNNTTTITTNFQTKLFICAGIQDIIPFDSDHYQIGIGFCDQDLNQYSVGQRSDDNAATTAITGRMATDRVAQHRSNLWQLEVTAISSTEVDLTTRVGTPGGSGIDHIYVAVGMDDEDARVFGYEAPTATGDDNLPTLPWTPQFISLVQTGVESTGTNLTDNTAGSLGIGAFTNDNEVSVAVALEDNSGASDTDSRTNTNAVYVPIATGSLMYSASAGTLAATTYLTYTTATPATGKQFFGFAIEESPAEPEPEPEPTIVAVVVKDTENLMYIEQVTFREPYSLQLVGGDDQRLAIFLKQRGLPGL